MGGSMTRDSGTTDLERLMGAGRSEQDAVDLGDSIFMSRDISNCYQVRTDDGVLMVNTGSPGGASAHRERFARAVNAPVRVIVLTQGHVDHFGGWHLFAGDDVETIVQSDHAEVRRYWTELAPHYQRRTQVLWGGITGVNGGGTDVRVVEPAPTTTFDDMHVCEIGGRRMELLAVPGGETTDSVAMWLPESSTVFTGNLFGPMLGHVPNLYTIRGDKLRSAITYVASVDRVRGLEPEVLITGHGEPVRGADRIAELLTRLRDATQWLHDATVDGMNSGFDVHTLMREVVPPPELTLGQGHGTVRWNVRAIWEHYSGWFHYDSTTSLYGVPASSIAGELVALAGADAVARRADALVADGRPLEALHLTDLVLDAEPHHRGALKADLAAHQLLLEQSEHTNLSETRWLLHRVDVGTAALEGTL
jgi:alkyl sulfatase BDS1-like metallo-beta-lactamase superfamily hydrolase